MIQTDRPYTRRSTMKIAGAGVLTAMAARANGHLAVAQDSTPTAGDPDGSAFADLGFPMLTITVTDTSFDGLEAQVAPGTYLVHATNAGAASANITFMQLPDGMTSADLLASLGGGGDAEASGNDQGSPVAEGDEELGAPPEWFYTVHLPGGVGMGPGQTAHFVITLQPGSYIVWGEDPSAPQAPIDLTVTGDPATAMAEAGITPEADVTIDEVNTADGYAFTMQGELVAGTQVLAVTNTSDQPHFVEIDRVPEGTTREVVDALFQGFMTGTPTAGGLTEDAFEPVYFVGTQSSGTTQWHEVGLEAGTYFIVCWIPDIARGGIPHAMEGMYEIVTVS